MAIYTRQGDYGKTSTVNGLIVSKGSALIELQGAIDEVNSGMGHLRSIIIKHGSNSRYKILLDLLNEQLKTVQHTLFRIGFDITSNFEKNLIKKSEIKALEKSIDLMTEKTGELDHFIYLSGHETASYAHVVRSMIRRAERAFVKLVEEKVSEDENFVIPVDYQYINRLADFLYQVARYLNWLFEIKEEIVLLDK